MGIRSGTTWRLQCDTHAQERMEWWPAGRPSSAAWRFLLATKGFSQIAGTGNIQGTVSDTTGAVIPNASVTLTDEATHVSRTTKTSGAGVYLFPGVPIGTYDLNVSASGFKTYEQTRNRARSRQQHRRESRASPSAARSRRLRSRPKASRCKPKTQRSSRPSTRKDSHRDAAQLAAQMTGLITLSGGSNIAPGGDFTGSKYSYQTISVSIAGGGGNTTLWRLDGGDNQDYMANGNLPYPLPRCGQPVQRGIHRAGRAGWRAQGGMVNVVTRSGTNKYHGSAFEFIRNNYIDATNFYSTCTPVAPATTCTPRTRCTRISSAAPSAAPSSATRCLPSPPTSGWKADQSQASHAGHCAHGGQPGGRLFHHGRQLPASRAATPVTQLMRPFNWSTP